MPPHLDGWHDELIATGPGRLPRYGNISAAGRALGQHHLVHPAATGIPARRGPRSTASPPACARRRQDLFTAIPIPSSRPIESSLAPNGSTSTSPTAMAWVHRALIADWQRRSAMAVLLIESDL